MVHQLQGQDLRYILQVIKVRFILLNLHSRLWKNVVSVLNREVKEDFRVQMLEDLVQKTTHSKLLLLWSRFLEVVKNLGDAGGDLVSRSD